MKTTLPLGPDVVERFESFVAGFRPVFHRADQFLRFRAYLRGLLEPTDRKNVEAIATAAATVMMVETNLAQSLQHFISQSPWDYRRLIATVRQRSRPQRQDSDATWVIHDGVFVKKGRHSIGVQRQHARSLGKKINCQLGVFVSQLGPGGYFPLASRLYLPGHWLRENAEAAEKLIPEEDRQPASKTEIALRLLDELQNEGEPVLPVLAESGYLTAPDFVDELGKKGHAVVGTGTHSVATAITRFDGLKADLGLDHFEGRTWHGWHHHVGLVFAAYHFLESERQSAPDISDS